MGIKDKIKEKLTTTATANGIMNALDIAYTKMVDGIPVVSPSIETLAQDYLKKKKTAEKAAKSMVNHQIAKCTVSGFITGFGGIITLPVSIPVNVGSVLYIQMRMIACTAYLAGYDVNCDQVQTLIYACLAGVSINEVVKKTGAKIGQKLAVNAIKKIPGKTLTKINQKVGFRLLTKFGSKGFINLGKTVPVVSSFVCGGFDLVETRTIGKRAIKMFFDGDYSEGTEVTPEEEAEAKELEAKQIDAEGRVE